MGKRPIQHVTGDVGVAETIRELSNAGWICEVVHKDYGEDISCQTSLAENVDPYRIFVQVKATKASVKRSFSIPIQRDLLRKWLLDTNLVLLVVWSIPDRKAYFTIPSELFNLAEVSDGDAKTIRVPIDCRHFLDSTSAKTIAWVARLRNINHQFPARTLTHQGLYKPSFDSVAEYAATKEALEQDLTTLVIQFLIFIGLLSSSEKRGAYVVNTAAFLEEMIYFGSTARDAILKGEKIDLAFENMCLLAIMLRASRIMPGVGLPEGFLDKSTLFYAGYIKDLVGTKSGQPKRMIISLVERLWKFGAQFEPGPELDEFVANFSLPKF